MVVAGGVGAAYGYLTGPGGSPSVPSPDQEVTLDEFGPPPVFVVADGPLAPGEEFARAETWGYPEAGVRHDFLDGLFIGGHVVEVDDRYTATSYSPAEFTRDLRRGDVEDLVGESGVLLPPIESEFDDLESYAYPGARLIVTYLDGWLYIVQTY
jgi:hypothetical protein